MFIKSLNESWDKLKDLAQLRDEKLHGAHEIQRYTRFQYFVCQVLVLGYGIVMLCRDADETKAWISEKDTALSSDDYGRDLASVQALQRKHEGLERDLAALEDKVRLSIDLNACLSVLLFVNSFVCLFICLSVYLVYLVVCLFLCSIISVCHLLLSVGWKSW